VTESPAEGSKVPAGKTVEVPTKEPSKEPRKLGNKVPNDEGSSVPDPSDVGAIVPGKSVVVERSHVGAMVAGASVIGGPPEQLGGGLALSWQMPLLIKPWAALTRE